MLTHNLGLLLAIRTLEVAEGNDDDQIPLASVSSITQTRDGYLWLGSKDQLFRFDGVRFVAVETNLPPGARIHVLFGSSDGALWVGSTAGLQRFSQAVWVTISAYKGQPLPLVSQIVEDHAGAIWAVTNEHGEYGLVEIAGGKVSQFGAADSVPSPVRALYVGKDGRLWVGSNAGACLWSGTRMGVCLPGSGQAVALAEDANRKLLISDAGHKGIHMASESGRNTTLMRITHTPVVANLLLQSSDTTLWVGTLGQGLIRITNQPGAIRMARQRYEEYRRTSGLSGDLVNALFEDREGNVWVGTSNGLDRFRRPRFLRYTTKEGLSSDVVTAIACVREGVWVGTAGGGLNRFDDHSIETGLIRKYSFPGSTITALCPDSRSGLWVGSTSGVTHQSGSQFLIPFVRSENQRALNRVFTIVETARGVWFNDADQRLLRFDPESKRLRTVIAGPTTNNIYRLEPSRDGGVWVGFYQGVIGKVSSDDKYTPLDPAKDSKGSLRALYEDRDGALWVGTSAGLYRYIKGVWQGWDALQGIPEGGIQGIAGSIDGGLYLVTSRAVLYLHNSARRALKGASMLVPDAQINLDDLHVETEARATGPRFSVSSDDRLWIGSDQGLVAIPPPLKWQAGPPPAVAIESIAVDRKTMAPSTAQESLKGLQIDFQYTAFTLTNPKRITFRYLLNGFNKDWIEVGSQRSATFTNLSPGKYRFCVTAASESGEWNKQAACQSFRVAPRFFQTPAFIGLVTLAIIGALYTTYHLRVRNIQNRFGLVLQERLRVARELHDTLLQGFAGISCQLQAAYRLIDTAPETGKARIELAMDQADDAIAQARQSISMLRLSALDCGLTEAISAAGERMTYGSGIEFRIISEGLFNDLPYPLEATLYMVACEAIHNAVKHAAPRHIEVGLSRDARSIRMAVVDDGRGFIMSPAGSNGHWGLRGMFERSQSIGITPHISSVPGEGTRVEIKIPISLLSMRVGVR